MSTSPADPSNSFGERLFVALQHVLPQHTLSALMHRFARSQMLGMRMAFTRWFVKKFQVNLNEAANPDLKAYASFNEFFTRELKADARPINMDDSIMVSPVDGAVSQIGPIRKNTILQAKGMSYTATQLLGDAERAKDYLNGQFTTLYLSPKDYHRIHMPVDAKLVGMTYVPGRLFSVNNATARGVPALFARNERVVAHFETAQGPLAMVLVGAIFVGSIETVWAGEVSPPRGKQVQHWDYSDKPVSFKKGDEMGRFNMGSTVILLGTDKLEWLAEYQHGTPVVMGKALAKLES